jgi:hypothetical protein
MGWAHRIQLKGPGLQQGAKGHVLPPCSLTPDTCREGQAQGNLKHQRPQGDEWDQVDVGPGVAGNRVASTKASVGWVQNYMLKVGSPCATVVCGDQGCELSPHLRAVPWEAQVRGKGEERQ